MINYHLHNGLLQDFKTFPKDSLNQLGVTIVTNDPNDVKRYLFNM